MPRPPLLPLQNGLAHRSRGMSAIPHLILGIALLLLLAAPRFASAQGDNFANNFPPELTFTEKYAEKVVTEVEDGILDYWDVPDETSGFTVTGRVSAQGIHLSTLDGNSPFQFFLGFLRLSGKLSDDPAYVAGKTSARIPLMAYDYNTDTNFVAGHLELSWTDAEIRISAKATAPETYGILLDHYIDENEQFNHTETLRFAFAGRVLNRTVYYRGKATTVTKVYGKGDSETELDINTIDASGGLDSTGPNVTITDPSEGAGVSTERISVSGTATDQHGISEVWVQANDGEFVLASINGNKWTAANLPLVVGVNVVRAKAIDGDGNETIVQRSVTRLTSLTVAISGSGTVTKGFAGTTSQAPGTAVTIQAKANPGYIFANWSGSITSTDPRITFVIEPGMMVTANFIPLPFGALSGRYAGLLQSPENSPSSTVQLTLAETGAFTAKFAVGGKKVKLKASFDANGRAMGTINRKGASPLEYELALDLEGGSGTIEGTIKDGGSVYTLESERASSSKAAPTPYAGTYTALLRPDSSEDGSTPTADGWASVQVRPNGKVKINGQLGDGTTFATNTWVSDTGGIPVYVTIAAARSTVAGKLQFTPADNGEFTGTMTWIKGSTGESPFPSGFEADLAVTGSKFTSSPVLNLPSGSDNAVLTIRGGDLPAEVTSTITVTPDGTVTAPASVSVKLKIKPTGTFTGSFQAPSSAQSVKFRGAIVQGPINAGIGIFVNRSEPGSITIFHAGVPE